VRDGRGSELACGIVVALDQGRARLDLTDDDRAPLDAAVAKLEAAQ